MSSPTTDLRHPPRSHRRDAWYVAAGLVLGLVGALLYLLLAGRDVTATTTVTVNVVSKDPFGSARSAADRLDGPTEIEIATSVAVLEDAVATLGDGTSLPDFRSRMSVEREPDSTIMRFSHTGADTDEAVAAADAHAQAYLDYRGELAAEQISTVVAQLEDQRDTLRSDLLRVNAIARDADPGSVEAVQAQTNQQLLTVELDSLVAQLNSFLGIDSSGGSVLTPAEDDTGRSGPRASLVVPLGLAIGLLLGLLAALLARSLGRRAGDEDEVQHSGGGAVLGELTGMRARIPPTEEDAEALRAVREVLLAKLSDRNPVIAVADHTTGEAVSDVAVNLAYLMTESDRDCQLVVNDADPKTIRRIAEGLVLTPAPDSGSDVRTFVGTDGLTLVAAGRRPLTKDSPISTWTPQDPAGSPAVTVVALPQQASSSSLLAAGRQGHAVVLVLTKGTKKSEIAAIAKDLAAVGAQVEGTVLVPKGRTPALSVLTGEAAYAPFPV